MIDKWRKNQSETTFVKVFSTMFGQNKSGWPIRINWPYGHRREQRLHNSIYSMYGIPLVIGLNSNEYL